MNKKAHLIYNVVDQTDEGVTIAFNGFVGDPEEGNDPTTIANVLHANKGKTVKLQIHSPGGFAADGIHIHDLLAMHDGPVITELHGWSASAATIISQAGHRTMSANASMLIHKAWGLTVGNSTDHKNATATLERMDESIVGIYLKKGAKEDKVYELMAENGGDGKFISAQEALEAGLIDEIFEPTQVKATTYAEIKALSNALSIPEPPSAVVQNLTAPVKTKESSTEEKPADVQKTERIQQLTKILKA